LNKVCEQRGYAIPSKRPRLHSNAKVSKRGRKYKNEYFPFYRSLEQHISVE